MRFTTFGCITTVGMPLSEIEDPANQTQFQWSWDVVLNKYWPDMGPCVVAPCRRGSWVPLLPPPLTQPNSSAAATHQGAEELQGACVVVALLLDLLIVDAHFSDRFFLKYGNNTIAYFYMKENSAEGLALLNHFNNLKKDRRPRSTSWVSCINSPIAFNMMIIFCDVYKCYCTLWVLHWSFLWRKSHWNGNIGQKNCDSVVYQNRSIRVLAHP